MNDSTATIISALIAVGGVILGTYISRLATKLNAEQEEAKSFIAMLPLLEKGSQRRNLGIAAIRFYLDKPKYHDNCISILIGSAVYLLAESNQEEAKHEILNLRHIMEILLNENLNKDNHKNKLSQALKQIKPQSKIQITNEQKKEDYMYLLTTVRTKLKESETKTSPESQKKTKGLVVDQDSLKNWCNQLVCMGLSDDARQTVE